jgi:hypothetical protein
MMLRRISDDPAEIVLPNTRKYRSVHEPALVAAESAQRVKRMVSYGAGSQAAVAAAD